MRELAKKILYKHCGGTVLNDGESLFYLGGQNEKILAAIEEALNIRSRRGNPQDTCDHDLLRSDEDGYTSFCSKCGIEV